MIIDLSRFVAVEEKYWQELEGLLDRMERDPDRKLSLSELRNFHYLYERTSADLANLQTFATDREIRAYLESLVRRAYGEIHETREQGAARFHFLRWFFRTFPQTFRRRIAAFWLTVGITLVGMAFGGALVTYDSEAKQILLPFPHLQGSPSERVAKEEAQKEDRLAGKKGTFSAFLMTHNIQVAIGALALGMTWGIGTILLLFYNGIILGAVGVDYVMAGQTKFLLGWLLPHGVIEIPAILVAGQAGLLIAHALIGYGKRMTIRQRLREVAPDLVTLICGCAIFLVWAGFVESFLSQYHEPVVPYVAKIAFGLLELTLLIVFLSQAGKEKAEDAGK